MQMLELSRKGSWKQSAPRAIGEACRTITKSFLESTKKGLSKKCTEEYHKTPGDSGISHLSLTSKKAHSSGFASPWTWCS